MLARVQRQCANRGTAGVKDGLIAITLVRANYEPQCLGHCERDQKIRHRQQTSGSLGEPGLRLVGLTVGTRAVATTATYSMLAPARLALVEQMAELSCTTSRDRRQHTLVLGRHGQIKLGLVRSLMLTQRVRDTGHGRALREHDHSFTRNPDGPF